MGKRKSKRFVSTPAAPTVPQCRVELLVQQFSDQFAFVREAIHNSILAGTQRVEISCHEGQAECEIRIEDWGAGVSLETVQQRIIPVTQGDWDFKNSAGHGLGFMSFFALAPHRLVLESGGHRVEFRYTTNLIEHEISPLEEPRQGTRFRWFKTLEPQQFRQYTRQMEITIRRCFHYPHTEIWLNGVDVRERRPIEHPLNCRLERPGLTVEVWPTCSESPYQEFLCDGMTLQQQEGPAVLPGVAFRVDCSELRATVTRDRVVWDEAYERSLREVRRLVKRELLPKLSATPGEAAQAYLSMHPTHCKLPLLSGGWIKLRELDWSFNLWDGVYWDEHLNEQAQTLIDRGIPVLRGMKDWMESALLQRNYRIYQASTSPTPDFRGAWEHVFRLYSRWAWR